MSRYSGGFFIKQSINGLLKNSVMSIASIIVLTSGLVIMGTFTLLMMIINENMDSVVALNKITVFFDYNATDEEIKTISEQVYSLENVKRAEYISKEQALQDYQKQYAKDYANIFEKLFNDKNNPLRASIQLEYDNVDKVDTLLYQLGQIEGIVKIRDERDIARLLSNIKRIITLIIIWFFIIELSISIIIIVNTIKLSVHARKSEVWLMRYIGATNSFIRAPFIIEGIIIGLVSATLALILQWYIYNYIIFKLVSEIELFKLLNYSSMLPFLLVIFYGFGIISGVFSSLISVKKYLKV
ncbi:MAG: cell division protein FtsX [Eubacteriales bacterium]